MDSSDFQVIKLSFGSLAAIAFLLGAWFTFRSTWQDEEEMKATIAQYRHWWMKIEAGGLLSLPERIISKILTALSPYSVNDLFGNAGVTAFKIVIVLAFLLPIFAGGAGYVLSESVLIGVLCICGSVPMVVIHWVFYRDMEPSVLLVYFGSLAFVAMYLGGLSAISEEILVYAIVCNIVFLWHIWLAFYLVIPMVSPLFSPKSPINDADWTASVVVALSISFPISLLALYIGIQTTGTQLLPNLLQLTVSNAVFDGLTMFTTFVLLRKAIDLNSKLSIPSAILLDIVLGAAFAIGALYFGLFEFSTPEDGPSFALTLPETFNVLIGYNTQGTEIEFGPYFWAMHTTFIPTLLYLSVIAFCWIGKLIVLPVAHIFRKGAAIEKPNALTAGAFGVVVAACALLSYAAGTLEEIYKEPKPQTHIEAAAARSVACSTLQEMSK